jgi:hypothetical protein
METKTFQGPIELKGEGKGVFECVFAKTGVIDRDEDWTEPGAFGEQEVVIEGWNHDMTIPAGKGRIYERGDEVVCDGQFFTKTSAGRDHYETVKAMGPLAQWSYTFAIKDAGPGRDGAIRTLKALDVHGVAPVTRGAGIDTRTVAIKAVDAFTPEQIRKLKALAEKWEDESEGLEENEEGEVEGEANGKPDDKPSGVSPEVIRTQIDILDLEE